MTFAPTAIGFLTSDPSPSQCCKVTPLTGCMPIYVFVDLFEIYFCAVLVLCAAFCAFALHPWGLKKLSDLQPYSVVKSIGEN